MVAEPRVAPRPVTPVSILAAKLADIADRLAQVDTDPVLLTDVNDACELAGGLDPYLELCTTPESAALTALAERTQAADWGSPPPDGSAAPLEQEMLSGHVEGQTLAFFVRATLARRVLEIGMFTGYSALAMAEALPSDGELVACEIDRGVADFAMDCFRASPAGDRITVKVGPALQTLQELAAAREVFDLIFIDADKPGYASYFSAVLDSGLLAPDGVMLVDNTLMQGQPWLASTPTANGAAIADFNRMVADDSRVVQVVLPLRDGLTLIRRVG